MAKFLERADELKEMLSGDGVVVADFFATWCGPCKMLMPVIDQVSKELEGKVKIVKIDVDKFSDLAAAHNIMSVPSLLFFKDGKLQEMSKGFKPREDVLKIINLYTEEN
jgi:thioredoxin 1